MSSHYTAPEMFLYTDTKFKQKTPNFNGGGWRAGLICPNKEKQPMGAKKGTNMGGT